MDVRKNIPVVLGTMTIGEPGQEGVRISDQKQIGSLLDAFRERGHTDIDAARMYGAGTNEKYLAEAGYERRGLRLDTKLYPTKGRSMVMGAVETYSHSAADVRRGLLDSLSALKSEHIQTFYLHGPDRATPIEETLHEVNQLHQEGLFDQFGVSNFQSWEVARICEICRHNGWIQPSIYQGLYNAYNRIVEAELFPCLRHYGVAFYAFNPLAGGFLTGRYRRDQNDVDEGGRFDPNRGQGKMHRLRYWNESNFAALDILEGPAKEHGLSFAACALRWLSHHSALREELGDKVIVGASSPEHLSENLGALEAGPLPQDIIDALDAGWGQTKAVAFRYWH